MKVLAMRVLWVLSRRRKCRWFVPGEDGVCRVCRWVRPEE